MGDLEKNELTFLISSPELKSGNAANTGLNCQQSCAENRRLGPSWRRERTQVRTHSSYRSVAYRNRAQTRSAKMLPFLVAKKGLRPSAALPLQDEHVRTRGGEP